MRINKAFILAAGLGERMRPLTDTCPKPLLEVDGRTMIDRALDACVRVGVRDIVVNLNYLGEMIEDHLKARTDVKITFSWEDELLETGGGVKKYLDHFKDEAFFVLNSDVIWTDAKKPALQGLMDNWDEASMDMLLMLYDKSRLPEKNITGDYVLCEGNHIIRNKDGAMQADYMFTGPRIVHPRLFGDYPTGTFSFRTLFDRAEMDDRLFGFVHEGAWYHVGTPEALNATEEILKKVA